MDPWGIFPVLMIIRATELTSGHYPEHPNQIQFTSNFLDWLKYESKSGPNHPARSSTMREASI